MFARRNHLEAPTTVRYTADSPKRKTDWKFPEMPNFLHLDAREHEEDLFSIKASRDHYLAQAHQMGAELAMERLEEKTEREWTLYDLTKARYKGEILNQLLTQKETELSTEDFEHILPRLLVDRYGPEVLPVDELLYEEACVEVGEFLDHRYFVGLLTKGLLPEQNLHAGLTSKFGTTGIYKGAILIGLAAHRAFGPGAKDEFFLFADGELASEIAGSGDTRAFSFLKEGYNQYAPYWKIPEEILGAGQDGAAPTARQRQLLAQWIERSENMQLGENPSSEA